MNDVTLIGIDLGKHVFHVHGRDAKGHAIFRKKLPRSHLLSFFSNLKAIAVVMKACAADRQLQSPPVNDNYLVRSTGYALLLTRIGYLLRACRCPKPIGSAKKEKGFLTYFT